MSFSAPLPTARSVPGVVRAVPVRWQGGMRGFGAFTRGRNGVLVLGASGLPVGLVAVGRAAWLAAAARRFARIRGPRFTAVAGPRGALPVPGGTVSTAQVRSVTGDPRGAPAPAGPIADGSPFGRHATDDPEAIA